MLALAAAPARRRAHPIRHLDLGGGLGIRVSRQREGAGHSRIHRRACRRASRESGLRVMVEPGRSIAGPAGVLLTRVLYRKKNGPKEFVVVDAAMNDLIRPALYHAHHEIVPVRKNALPPVTADVVGPICETGDFLARDRQLANVMPGDFLAVCAAGRVRLRAVLELQFAPARAGSAGGRRRISRDSPARNVRGPGARRDGVISVTNRD